MTLKAPDRDTTVEDIHHTRMQLAEKFGNDIAAILADARKRQADSGRTIWQGPRSNPTPQPTVTPNGAAHDSKSHNAAPVADA